MIRVNQEIINPQYLKIFFESKKGIETLSSIRSGGVLPSISASQIKEIIVPVLCREEQEEIIRKYLAKKDEIKIIKRELEKLQQTLQDITNEGF